MKESNEKICKRKKDRRFQFILSFRSAAGCVRNLFYFGFARETRMNQKNGIIVLFNCPSREIMPKWEVTAM